MDIISDMLARIRNGLMARKATVDVIHSKQNLGILKVLMDEGYISSFSEEDLRPGVKKIVVLLKYYNNSPVIQEIKRISKSSRRVYSAVEDLKPINNGLGISILSTSKGIISNIEAKSRKVGGEVICTVF